MRFWHSKSLLLQSPQPGEIRDVQSGESAYQSVENGVIQIMAHDDVWVIPDNRINEVLQKQVLVLCQTVALVDKLSRAYSLLVVARQWGVQAANMVEQLRICSGFHLRGVGRVN